MGDVCEVPSLQVGSTCLIIVVKTPYLKISFKSKSDINKKFPYYGRLGCKNHVFESNFSRSLQRELNKRLLHLPIILMQPLVVKKELLYVLYSIEGLRGAIVKLLIFLCI